MTWQQALSTHGLGWVDLLGLWAHFMLLSLLAVGGAITTAPMPRSAPATAGWAACCW